VPVLFFRRMSPEKFHRPAEIRAPLAEPRARGSARVLDMPKRLAIRRHYDETAKRPRRQKRISRFYYQDTYDFIREQVPAGARVLELGCGDGMLLASLQPSYGVGVDTSEGLLREARRNHPSLDFICADVEELPLRGPFDYVIVTNVIGFLLDVWSFFRNVEQVIDPSSRLIITYYNFAWEPLLKLGERIGLKGKEPLQNWLSRQDVVNLLELTNFEAVASGYRTPLPIGPRRVMKLPNRILSALPVLRHLGITCYVTARWRPSGAFMRSHDPSCSVVIPTRNERGNIRPAISRLPQLGSHTEVVFVDGNSVDGTPDEIRQVIEENPEMDIKLIHQGSGRGKGDAVRKGFAAASGEVLMILDADLTVPPEDLPKFYHALVEERGEFINGSRLVYPLEDQAMRLANIFGNKAFSIVFSWILDQRITDTLCGTKVMRRADYERLVENRKVFGDFDPFGDFDLLFGSANLGLRIREVPVRYRPRAYGSTNIQRWRHGLLLLRMAISGARRLRFR
jgi:SAM-dependent methyltransferase